MTNRRVVSLSMPAAGIAARASTGLTGLSHTPGYVPRHAERVDWLVLGDRDVWLDRRMTVTTAPVAATPSTAATVKAGGVATLTGGDTTQPETQR